MISQAKIYIQDVYKKQFAPQRLRGKAAHTRSLYETTLHGFERVLGRPATVDDLNDENAAAYLSWFEQQPGKNGESRAPRTINNRRSYLFCFWRWCAKHNLTNVWPDVPPLDEPDKNPSAWNQQQLKALFRACRNFGNGKIAGVGSPIPGNVWWTAFHQIMWDTGERTHAVLAIEISWINFQTGVLHVPAKVRKGGKKSATYQLKPKTMVTLSRMLVPQRKSLFDFVGNICTFYTRYEELLKSAGLPHDRTCKPQKMRRSFATHIEALGGNATKALNHSRRSVTEKSYLDKTILSSDSENRLLFDL